MGDREIAGINLFILRNGPDGEEDSVGWAVKKEEYRRWLAARRGAFREASPMLRAAVETVERLLDSDPPTGQCRTGRVLRSLAEALQHHESQAVGLPPPFPFPEAAARAPAPPVLYWQFGRSSGEEADDVRLR